MTKDLARKLAEPNKEDLAKLKHLLKYLQGTRNYYLELHPTIRFNFNEIMDIVTYVDSDWAGCSTTRKSTSGVVLQILGATIFTCSRTQGTIALSSGEAELYAI